MIGCARVNSIVRAIIVVVRSANQTFCLRSEPRLSDSCFQAGAYSRMIPTILWPSPASSLLSFEPGTLLAGSISVSVTIYLRPSRPCIPIQRERGRVSCGLWAFGLPAKNRASAMVIRRQKGYPQPPPSDRVGLRTFTLG